MLAWLLRMARYGVVAVASGLVVFVSADTWLSLGLPDLEVWHRVAPEGEFTAEIADRLDFAGYRALEAEVLRELDAAIYARWGGGGSKVVNRYRPGSISDPRRFEPNYNYSFELPVDEPRGAVVLVHGLTDSPYSMRALAETFRGFGYHAIVPRLPGHGTTPAALDDIAWQDWAAAVSLAIEHGAALAGGRDRLHLVGYSTGAALVLNHVVETLLQDGPDAEAPAAAGLYLFAPSVGVTSLARFANLNRLVSRWAFFEKARWLGVLPEYDPYKYNSFPKNAARQIHLLTSHLASRLASVLATELDRRLPPIVLFQSLVDDTVDIAAVENLFRQLPSGDHELVVFDINHAAVRQGLILPGLRERTLHPFGEGDLPSWRTLVTNEGADRNEVKEQRWAPGETEPSERSLPYRWPEWAYSLSHLSLPFSPDDPIYGAARDAELPLGRIHLKGERGVLVVPETQMVRLRHNPFYAYVEEKLRARVAPP